MLALHDDPNSENSKTSHLLTALYAAVQIQKRKVVVGPYDSVGIMFYNTVRLLSSILLPPWQRPHPSRREGMRVVLAQR
jgi:hypothetical protein